MSNWETVLFQNAAYIGALTTEEMCGMRSVCIRWNNAIETVDDVYEKIIDISLLQRLYYSKREDGRPSVYGKDCYEKERIQRKWKALWNEYEKPMLACLEYVEDDLFEDDTVVSVERCKLPLEFELFIKRYKDYPNTKIRLYHPRVLQKLLLKQMVHTQKHLNKSDCIVHLTPICYSKHYKANMEDRQFISALCYVNALNDEVLDDLGSFYERFHVITLEITDMQDKLEHYESLYGEIFDITKKIEGNIGYLEDLDLMTFCQCYDRLLKKQKYNL
jgi:hypothetical protein